MISNILLGVGVLALAVADVITTKRAISLGATESNPIVSKLQSWFPNAWPYFRVAMVAPALVGSFFISPIQANILFGGTILLYSWVVYHNIGVIKTQKTNQG